MGRFDVGWVIAADGEDPIAFVTRAGKPVGKGETANKLAGRIKNVRTRCQLALDFENTLVYVENADNS